MQALKEFKFRIKATVIKDVTVISDDFDEAEKRAHERFSVVIDPDNPDEKYNQETLASTESDFDANEIEIGEVMAHYNFSSDTWDSLPSNVQASLINSFLKTL